MTKEKQEKVIKIEKLILENFESVIKKGGIGEDFLDVAYRLLKLLANVPKDKLKNTYDIALCWDDTTDEIQEFNALKYKWVQLEKKAEKLKYKYEFSVDDTSKKEVNIAVADCKVAYSKIKKYLRKMSRKYNFYRDYGKPEFEEFYESRERERQEEKQKGVPVR